MNRKTILGVPTGCFWGVIAVCVIGIIIGSISGYYGAWVDNLMMRLLDIYQAIPMFLLCVALAAILGASLRNAIIALGLGIVPGYARIMRASVMTVRM